MKKHTLSLAALAVTFALAASPETDEAAKLVTEKKLSNCANNGSFVKLTDQGKKAANWTFWKTKDSKATITFEKKAGFKESNAAVLTGGKASLFSRITIQPGVKIYARVMAKKTGGKNASFSLRFQTAKGKFLPVTVSEVINSKDGEWTSVEIVAAAPKDAGYIIPMLSGLSTPEGTISYSKFEIYRLPQSAKGK